MLLQRQFQPIALLRKIGASILRICVALSCVFVGVWEDTFKAQKGWVVARWSSEGVNNGGKLFINSHYYFFLSNSQDLFEIVSLSKLRNSQNTLRIGLNHSLILTKKNIKENKKFHFLDIPSWFKIELLDYIGYYQTF